MQEIEEQDRQLAGHSVQTFEDSRYPPLQVRQLVELQARQFIGQLLHKPLLEKYPRMHKVQLVEDEQAEQ